MQHETSQYLSENKHHLGRRYRAPSVPQYRRPDVQNTKVQGHNRGTDVKEPQSRDKGAVLPISHRLRLRRGFDSLRRKFRPSESGFHRDRKYIFTPFPRLDPKYSRTTGSRSTPNSTTFISAEDEGSSGYTPNYPDTIYFPAIYSPYAARQNGVYETQSSTREPGSPHNSVASENENNENRVLVYEKRENEDNQSTSNGTRIAAHVDNQKSPSLDVPESRSKIGIHSHNLDNRVFSLPRSMADLIGFQEKRPPLFKFIPSSDVRYTSNGHQRTTPLRVPRLPHFSGPPRWKLVLDPNRHYYASLALPKLPRARVFHERKQDHCNEGI